jgi:hypothetical protein
MFVCLVTDADLLKEKSTAGWLLVLLCSERKLLLTSG